MPCFVCETCGVQHAESAAPPERCAICEDERQYVGWGGQRWTTLEELRRTHRNELRDDHGLVGIGVTPEFGIGQRALLVPGRGGNVLWGCTALLDSDLPGRIRALGGLSAVAIDHPHFYSTMVEWAEAFSCPVFLHAADRSWVMRPDERLVFWEGETYALAPGLTLVRLGGHFDGGSVLHWADGQALLAGDIITVVQDRRFVGFMYSYPNLIPLPARQVRRMAAALEPFSFDRIYGGWFGRVVERGGKEAVRRSAERYVRRLSGGGAL